MTDVYCKFYNLFCNSNIGQLGIEFFSAIGHLCDSKAKYVESDPVVLIKEDLQSFVQLDNENLEALSYVRQISYVGRLSDDVFERKSDDGFISYFAVDVDVPFDSCAKYIKTIQRILMKSSNRHTIVLYKVSDYYMLSYGYRNVGKNSNVVYSDWIIDDISAEEIMDNANACYFSFRSLPRFASDFQQAIRRDRVSKALSFEAIAFEIFPQFYEEYGFDEERTPKKEDRNEFVIWYRKQHPIEYDEFDDDSFFLTKENMLDDFEIDVDELEMQMLEAEMRGEEFVSSSSDGFEEMELSEFEQAIKIVDSGEFIDAEDVLKQLESSEEKNAINLDNISTSEISNISVDDWLKDTTEKGEEKISGVIEEILNIATPEMPFKLRRTTWKRQELYFVVEEIKGSYAYGYILDNGEFDRKTSYPIKNPNFQWILQESQKKVSKFTGVVFEGENACVKLTECFYDAQNDVFVLNFETENLTNIPLVIFLEDITFDDEVLEGFQCLGNVEEYENIDLSEEIENASLELVDMEYVSSISFTIEIDDEDFNMLESSGKVKIDLM